MNYTDIGSGGKIYDSNEPLRLQDFADKQEKLFLEAEKIDGKDKKITRYFIIIGGAILLLTALKLLVKNKKQ